MASFYFYLFVYVFSGAAIEPICVHHLAVVAEEVELVVCERKGWGLRSHSRSLPMGPGA